MCIRTGNSNLQVSEEIYEMLKSVEDMFLRSIDTPMKVVNDETGGIYVLDGDIGKTILISLILATIRSYNEIVLVLASSDIVATLLKAGRTAHSTLKLPLTIQPNETPNCNNNSAMAKVLKEYKLIVLDKCMKKNLWRH